MAQHRLHRLHEGVLFEDLEVAALPAGAHGPGHRRKLEDELLQTQGRAHSTQRTQERFGIVLTQQVERRLPSVGSSRGGRRSARSSAAAPPRAHRSATHGFVGPGADRAVENAPWPLRAEVFRNWLARTRKHLAAVGSSADTGPARVKLKRWPPAEMMRSDPSRIRMATLLSRRAMSAHELARLAQCSQQRCEQFLTVLHGFALLEPVVVPAKPAPAPAFERAAPSRWDLVKSLRRRLGLAGAA